MGFTLIIFISDEATAHPAWITESEEFTSSGSGIR
jgi:hypothetical protein